MLLGVRLEYLKHNPSKGKPGPGKKPGPGRKPGPRRRPYGDEPTDTFVEDESTDTLQGTQ